jgi:hypothetical protein
MRRVMITVVLVSTLACGGTDESPNSGPGIPAGAAFSISPVTANIPPSGPEVLAAFSAVRDAGARGYLASYRWSELEPQPGQYALTDLQSLLQTITGLGFTRILLNIQAINTTQKETPADLVGVAWDAPQMQIRFRALLDQIAPLLGPEVKYVAIGNEVDSYLGANNQWAAYQAFFSQARAYLRTLRPGQLVGVTTIFDGARGTWKTPVQALNALADVAVYTYYGNDGAFQDLPPSAGVDALDEMVALAAGKPVIVQEFGQASTPVNGGSDDLQARFFAASLARWHDIGGAAIPFLSVFALYDFPPWLCDELLTYYGTGPNTAFREYLCSLGLKRQDGTSKPSWDSVRAFGRR